MNRDEIDKVERDPVTRKNFTDALRQILTTDEPKRPRSENRDPTKAELEQRWKLKRRRR